MQTQVLPVTRFSGEMLIAGSPKKSLKHYLVTCCLAAHIFFFLEKALWGLE